MRKILLILLMIVVIVFLGYTVYAGMLSAPSYTALNDKSKNLDAQIKTYETKNANDLKSKQSSINKQIEQYQGKKEEYEEVVERKRIEQESLDAANCYDIDYLWAKVGNYATEHGVELIFDVVRNATDANKSEYVLTDLKFTITSEEYIQIANFVKEIEDDSKLNFEIREFNINVEEVVEKLKKVEITKATFVVYGVAINKATLTGNIASSADTTAADTAAPANTAVGF